MTNEIISVESFLTEQRVRIFSLNGSMTDVMEILDSRDDKEYCINAAEMVGNLIGIVINFEDRLYARLYVKYLIEYLYNNGWKYNKNVDELVEELHEKATKFVNDPNWSFLSKEVIESDLDVKAAVFVPKVGNKIVRGGKQVLCKELFIEHIIDTTPPISFKELKQIFMKEVGLTDKGSNTYLHNLKSEYGMIKQRG